MKDSPLTACGKHDEKSEPQSVPDGRENFRANFRVMLIVLCVGVILMATKFCGYWVSGSSAILSDALESIINVVASGFGLGSVVFSAKPADESHPYGHGTIEFFSAGFEGALIMIAAGGIFWEGLKQTIEPQLLPNLRDGLFFLVAAGVGNLVLGVTLLRVGKRTKSIVLEADGKHLLSDVLTSAAVLVGLVVVYFTEWYRFDGIIACIAGVNIVFLGVQLVRKALGGLMHSADPDLLNEICDLLGEHKKDLWIDIHRLRAWRSGSRVHVDFHLILPRDLPLEDSHREVKDLENAFDAHFGGMSDLLVHLDPCLDPECPVCAVDSCDLRQDQMVRRKIWNREGLTGGAESHEKPNNR